MKTLLVLLSALSLLVVGCLAQVDVSPVPSSNEATPGPDASAPAPFECVVDRFPSFHFDACPADGRWTVLVDGAPVCTGCQDGGECQVWWEGVSLEGNGVCRSISPGHVD